MASVLFAVFKGVPLFSLPMVFVFYLSGVDSLAGDAGSSMMSLILFTWLIRSLKTSFTAPPLPPTQSSPDSLADPASLSFSSLIVVCFLRVPRLPFVSDFRLKAPRDLAVELPINFKR